MSSDALIFLSLISGLDDYESSKLNDMSARQRALFLVISLFLIILAVQRLSSNRGSHLQSPRNIERLTFDLSSAFPYERNDSLPTTLWQTWKYSPLQAEFDSGYRYASSSWSMLNPGYEHHVISDDAASALVARLYFRFPEVKQAYEALPRPILKADFFRYLILLVQGGIYSDIDTIALKPISSWVATEMEPYGLVVGIEADPDRPDWHDWYARRIQFCQWTIASKPGHPVLVDIVASITNETLERKQRDELRPQAMKTVMEFTGPGVWTDMLFNFFNRPSESRMESLEGPNVTWERFSALRQATKESDVVVLPVTSFSPGVGHMGAGSTSDPWAFVKHTFSGGSSQVLHWPPDSS